MVDYIKIYEDLIKKSSQMVILFFVAFISPNYL